LSRNLEEEEEEEEEDRCTSSVLNTCLRNDVLASCLLTKHTPDDMIAAHAP